MNRYGVWLVGARGGLATTLQVGARAIVHGLCSRAGLAVDRPSLLDSGLPSLEELRFGGHDIRACTLAESASEIYRRNGSIRYETIEALKGDLAEIDKEVRPGVLVNSGEAIDKLGEANYLRREPNLSAAVDALATDIASFRDRKAPDGVVLVNLSSTEPVLEHRDDVHREPEALLAAVRANRTDCIRSSTLYSLAAIQVGAPIINFTPSNAALVEAARKLALSRGLPYMGNDGKTGETLVKSALAPMFKYRALRVLTWQGYNMLGDRDGAVLADERNKASKVRTKDSLLAKILGYPLHTKVEIDYVPSLDDLKTAWDFIHFQGFLDYKMSMQFTWQGCDSILAAPLVLDMARMAHLARKRGESGPMRQLACFFKDPLGVDEQDLHRQFHLFLKYLGEAHGDEESNTDDNGACGAPARLVPDVAVSAKPAPSVTPLPTAHPDRSREGRYLMRRGGPALALVIALVALARHGLAQDPPASKAPPAAADTKKPSSPPEELDKFLSERGVKLDRKANQIHVTGWVNMQKGLIEVLACTPDGKTHEAALALECVPSALNAAFLALGYKPGSPVVYGTERYSLPKGEPVWITVEWKAATGETKRVRAEEIVYDRSTESAMATMAWIYVGSQMQAGPDTAKPTFAADAIKSLVTTYHDPTSIIENPLDSGQDDTLFFSNEKVLPPQRTPVTVTFWKSEPPRSAG